MISEDDGPRPVYLKDYQPPDYRVAAVSLRFDLAAGATTVTARLDVRRGPDTPADRPLVLDGGPDLELVRLAIDGEEVGPNRYQRHQTSLILDHPPDEFQLEVTTRIQPAENKSLMGLYQSGSMLCTQCEAEGFRNITFFPDRPDVMATYSTTLVADKIRYPVLLSNGNPTGSGEEEGGRHWVTWNDPFAKPSYLFALVAGDLDCLRDSFTTASGRVIPLAIYTEHGQADSCRHAMESLKRAMAWDQDNYGREYDLDVFNIVAVGDFNFGAMENKGLNIYNSKYILAQPETATDQDYLNIAAVVAHEYFHNWTGNRITCRDWFQLSLKEGLTVFRDQQFSADLSSPAVRRIEDVQGLRVTQFAEDAGPMAHPVRPPSYIEINNFYTATVYEKGAEVVRMLHTLLGPDGFRRGADLYFQRHDGQAVTTDDFVRCMEAATGRDLTQFRLWYSQSGTPRITMRTAFDQAAGRLDVTLRQSCPPTPGQTQKNPFHIPVTLALLDGEGNALALRRTEDSSASATECVLELRDGEETFSFHGLATRPTPSVLRNFSAPVKLEAEYSDQELIFLWTRDQDPFNAWEAGQQLAVRLILALTEQASRGRPMALDPLFIAAFDRILQKALEEDGGEGEGEGEIDLAMIAKLISLPDEGYLAEQMEIIAVDPLHRAVIFTRHSLATALRDRLAAVSDHLAPTGPFARTPREVGRRALRNLCLDYLMALDDPAINAACLHRMVTADNMTDEVAALRSLAHGKADQRGGALAGFYDKWRGQPLVLDMWFQAQAASRREDTLEAVKSLAGHADFTTDNPNRARALLAAFSLNRCRFHHPSGGGYAFLADFVLKIDPDNANLAARLMSELIRWRRFDESRGNLMRAQLERIVITPGLSKGAYELATKSLQ